MGVTGVGRERFLADASRILASSLDLREILKSVAELVVPYLADWCVVDLLEDGQIRRSAIAQCDGDAEMEAAMYRWAPDPNQPRGVARVIANRRSELTVELTEKDVAKAARGPEHLVFLRKLGICSYMCVPMVARGKVRGTLMLLTTQSRRRYDRDDLALAEDLAVRSAMAVDNARLYQRVEDANRSMDSFLATVSHELRTPLAAMKLWCDLLRDKKQNPHVAERALDAIGASIAAQSRLIDDLLDLSRIQSDTLLIQREPTAIGQVVLDAAEMVQPTAASKGLDLSVVIEEAGDPILIMGDAPRLRQVIVNLLSNAIKFTPERGAVQVVVKREDKRAVIEVADTGKGIPPEVVPRIFDRFYQFDPDRSGMSGLGLGLTIVRRLVGLHEGFVTASSPGINRGATFSVHLPTVEQMTAQEPRIQVQEAPHPIVTSPLQGVEVLFVEDEPAISAVVTMALESQGAHVTAAASVKEALERLAEALPDVLLSDIAMPGEDGYSLIRKVRGLAADRGGKLPAAALTAHVRPEDRIRALQAGFHAHIRKPVDLDELTSCVARLAGR
jgi:signal transduction histidine kinase/CheY-like chemotaxis protein